MEQIQYYTLRTIRRKKNNFSKFISIDDQYLQLRFLVYLYPLELFMMPVNAKSIQMGNLLSLYLSYSPVPYGNKEKVIISKGVSEFYN